MTALAYDETMSDWRTHDGIDIEAKYGTVVSAMASGTVTKVYYDDLYGTTVVTEREDGLRCTYANLCLLYTSGTAQKPNCPPARSTPQPRGQMEQSCVIMPPAHGVLREIYGFCGYYKVFSSISQPSSACFMKSSEIQRVPVVALFKREIAKKAASG